MLDEGSRLGRFELVEREQIEKSVHSVFGDGARK